MINDFTVFVTSIMTPNVIINMGTIIFMLFILGLFYIIVTTTEAYNARNREHKKNMAAYRAYYKTGKK